MKNNKLKYILELYSAAYIVLQAGLFLVGFGSTFLRYSRFTDYPYKEYCVMNVRKTIAGPGFTVGCAAAVWMSTGDKDWWPL